LACPAAPTTDPVSRRHGLVFVVLPLTFAVYMHVDTVVFVLVLVVGEHNAATVASGCGS
jgi:hypothetical protein